MQVRPHTAGHTVAVGRGRRASTPPTCMTSSTAYFPPSPTTSSGTSKADIAERGVMVPLEVHEPGAVLDGYHRLQAWRELSAEGTDVPPPPVVVRSGLSHANQRLHRLALSAYDFWRRSASGPMCCCPVRADVLVSGRSIHQLIPG